MKYFNAWPLFIIITALLVIQLGCDDDDETGEIAVDTFERGIMLEFWADEIIIPAFNSYVTKLEALQSAHDVFQAQANESTLAELRNVWLQAYLSWQDVSMFDIGRAEEIGLRNFTNIYPTDVTLIESNALDDNYNLSLPSNFDAQGFPALDYMLHGLGESDQEIISQLTTEAYRQYLETLVDRLVEISTEVRDHWEAEYRDQFVANAGSSATASTDKMVNDFLFYYEKFLRAAKVGIPAGVFSGSELPQSVEGPYSDVHSQKLFLAGLQAVDDFFVGRSFDGSLTGESLSSYLAYVAENGGPDNVGPEIVAQWDVARQSATQLLPSFSQQVELDNFKMLATYDELQKVVVLLKVDMLHALNIQVDFVDADGD